MDLVVDANILFAVLIKSGKTEELLFSQKLNLFAPEFLFDEFEKYKALILEKTSKTEKEFIELLSILQKRIIVVSNIETEPHILLAKEISPDKNDSDYFALALKLNCAIWSNDKELKKQNKIPIYSTEEIMTLIDSGS